MARHHSALTSNVMLLAALAAGAGVSLIFALSAGSLWLGWSELWSVIQGKGDVLSRNLVFELRLPRALCAFATGGMLALAGALMQVLLRNPLADPYVLGISGGAAVGALLCLMAGTGGILLSGGAFGGALLSMLIVFALARGEGTWGTSRLLLTGIVVSAGWGAAISLLLSISPDSTLRGMIFWLLGDLSDSGHPGAGMAVLAIGLVVALISARSLNVLVQGDDKAKTLGVNVEALRIRLYLLASLVTAAAVTLAGNVGFVGLIVPHLVRPLAGSDHRILLPASALAGATLLVVADTLARSIAAPMQLPVGVVTALIGVPIFLYLLRRLGRS
jgi:iron complex transport system permease protein